MLLDGIYVFFEVCAGLGVVIGALWLLTRALGFVYEVATGEFFAREAPDGVPRADRGSRLPTAG